LTETIIQHRLELLTRIIRLLLTMIPEQRQRTLKEQGSPYSTGTHALVNREELAALPQNVPLPKP